MKRIVCVHLTKSREIWKDDKTIVLKRCVRCHTEWNPNDPDPVVVIAHIAEDDKPSFAVAGL